MEHGAHRFAAALGLDWDGLGKQLKYAAAKGIAYAVIVGPDEAGVNKATLRDLGSGEQVLITQNDLAEALNQKSKIKNQNS